MEGANSFSLDLAKASFLSLLSRVGPSEAGHFVDWVVKHCSSINSNNVPEEIKNVSTPEKKKMKKIIRDIKKRVPFDGILSSENICQPEGKVKSTMFNYIQGLLHA